MKGVQVGGKKGPTGLRPAFAGNNTAIIVNHEGKIAFIRKQQADGHADRDTYHFICWA